MPFLSTLNYSSVNEDWRTEATALKPRDDDTILCVTGSGDRPLNLLALSNARVHAVDLNPAQTCLLELKIAAMRTLPFEEYMMFLGASGADPRWRLATLSIVAESLAPLTLRYWQDRAAMIRAGVIYAGRWERHHARLALLARALRGRVIDALFELDDLGAQRRFVTEQWDRPWWRGIFALACHPITSQLLHRDPAFYRGTAVSVGSYLFERMRQSLWTVLARENFMISLVLRGRLTPFDMPPWLTSAGVAVIRGRLDLLTLETADVRDLMSADRSAGFSAWSLSDLPSYLSAADYASVLHQLASAAPRTRFCIRHFLTRQAWPTTLDGRLRRDLPLERRLAAADRAFAYEFRVGQVCGEELVA